MTGAGAVEQATVREQNGSVQAIPAPLPHPRLHPLPPPRYHLCHLVNLQLPRTSKPRVRTRSGINNISNISNYSNYSSRCLFLRLVPSHSAETRISSVLPVQRTLFAPGSTAAATTCCLPATICCLPAAAVPAAVPTISAVSDFACLFLDSVLGP